MTMAVKDATWRPRGCYQTADLSTAVGCPSLAGLNSVRGAIIQAVDNDVAWRDDGTTATNSSGGSFGGMILAAGESFFYIGELTKLSFIEAGSGNTAYINIAYYG